MNQKGINAKKNITWLIFSLGPLISLAVSPYANYDPINLIKNLFLTSVSFSVLFIFIINKAELVSRIPTYLKIIFLGLLVTLMSAFFFSRASLSAQFWGTFGRNTGFLTYLSLFFICFVIAIVADQQILKKILESLVYTSIPVTLYCLIQIAKLDPIPWSLHQTFATFGNINFLSAFLGLSTIALFNLLFESKLKPGLKILTLLLLIVQLLIIYSTDSIQGLMMFIAGASISAFLLIRDKAGFFYKYSKWPMVCGGVFSVLIVVLGLFNEGFLAKVLYQPSVVYRGDYMHAGWSMTLEHPIFGVGLDQYGSWYRYSRGLISTTRNSADRTADTAHNIFLDISSGGGFPLLIAYLSLISYTFYIAVRRIKENPNINKTIISIFAIWISYQIQSLISINQIAVGIWGWIFTGVLLSMYKTDFGSKKIQNEYFGDRSKTQIRKKSRSSNSAGNFPIGILGLIFGFVLAFIPLKADADFKSALESRDLNRMIESIKQIGSTPFHLTQVINAAANSGYFDQARELTLMLNEKDPRDFYGWKMLYSLPNSSQDERNRALNNMRELDPYNPSISKS